MRKEKKFNNENKIQILKSKEIERFNEASNNITIIGIE